MPSPNLPVASPVLIQSGLAILAMAKISAARKRHPDMTVSLSISQTWMLSSLLLYIESMRKVSFISPYKRKIGLKRLRHGFQRPISMFWSCPVEALS